MPFHNDIVILLTINELETLLWDLICILALSEGFTIIVLTIVYFVSAAKVVMVDGRKKSYKEILHG